MYIDIDFVFLLVHLHDEFIRASINTRKKNQKNVKNATSSQKKKTLKEIMSSMGKEERDKLQVILKVHIYFNCVFDVFRDSIN